MSGKEISLYVHIPFCTRKCPYCHFYVVQDKANLKDLLIDALFLEWDRNKHLFFKKNLVSIYFGGGTPILFESARLEKFINYISKDVTIDSTAEITIEANPENSSAELFSQLHALGINRLSIGIQSLNDSELVLLGREHSSEKALQAIDTAHKSGFDNISCDLMYDIPQQMLASWHRSLHTLAKLPITHISLYNLTFEPHTPFARKEKELKALCPDEEISLQMYLDAQTILKEHDFLQYEISAFAKGKISRHNIGYWTGRPFVGLGPSAWSYIEGKRFQNTPNLVRYAQALKSHHSPIEQEEIVSEDKRRRELFVLQLRLLKGCNLGSFEKEYGALELETHEQVKALLEKGFLLLKGGTLSLTEKGVLFYDTVAVELI